MAGMSVTVCIPDSYDTTVERAVAERLDVFGPEVEFDGDWMLLWDSWWISGGREEYGFWPALGYDEDPRLIRRHFLGPRAVQRDGAPSLHLPLYCAGGPRSLLDLGERPDCPRELAMQTWDVWHDLSDRYAPAHTLSEIVEQHRRSPHGGFDYKAVETAFGSQPLVQAFKQAHPLGGRDRLTYSDEFVFHPNDLIQYAAAGREAFADTVVRPKVGVGALLTLDGWWIESEEEVYHGECAGTTCPHGPHPYAEALRQLGAAEARSTYLRELSGNVVLVQVHGHC